MFNLELTGGHKAVRIDSFDQFQKLINELISAKPEDNSIWQAQIDSGNRGPGWFAECAPIGIHTRIHRDGYCSQWADLAYYVQNGYEIISYDDILECEIECETLEMLSKVLFD